MFIRTTEVKFTRFQMFISKPKFSNLIKNALLSDFLKYVNECVWFAQHRVKNYKDVSNFYCNSILGPV